MPDVSEVLKGQLKRVSVVAQERTGRRPSPATTWRWIKRGIRGGVKLDALKCGEHWVTTPEAFDKFLLAQTSAAFQRTEAPNATDAELEAAGLL